MDKEEKVDVPIGHDNPLLHKLSAQQFQASIKFYEADSQLNTDDRVAITQDLQSVITKTSFASYGTGLAAFFGPSMYQRIKKPNADPITRRLIQRPFFSFLLGLSGMLVTNTLMYRYLFAAKAEELETSNITRANVWRSMDYHQAALFYLYFRKTSDDPSYVVKDPRTFTEQQMHEVHYDPKHSRTPRRLQDDYATSVSGKTHWEEIRQQNGFVNDSPPAASSAQSAWDKVRDSK